MRGYLYLQMRRDVFCGYFKGLTRPANFEKAEILLDFAEGKGYELWVQWCWRSYQKHCHLTAGHGVVWTEIITPTASCDSVVRQPFDESAERMANRHVCKSSQANIWWILKGCLNENRHLGTGYRGIGAESSWCASARDSILCEPFDESTEKIADRHIVKLAYACVRRISER